MWKLSLSIKVDLTPIHYPNLHVSPLITVRLYWLFLYIEGIDVSIRFQRMTMDLYKILIGYTEFLDHNEDFS